METNRDFKGVWIPRDIYLDETLSWTEKILLVEIDSLDRGDGCWASNAHFGAFLGVSEGQGANLISALRKRGCVTDRDSDGRKRRISVNPTFRKTLTETARSAKAEGEVQQKLNDRREILSGGGSTGSQNEQSFSPRDTLSNTNTPASINSRVSLGENPDTTPPPRVTRTPLPRKRSGYDENAPSTSYDAVIDAETNETIPDSTPPSLNASYRALMDWAKDRRGSGFMNISKQMAAMKRMRNAGKTMSDVKNRWAEMENDDFWGKKGFDFMDVCNSFDRK